MNDFDEPAAVRNHAAEQSVLGAMMLSKAAICDVTEILTGPDFYRRDHELIFEAAVDLHERGQAADPVTVAELLTKSGYLDRCGGAPYLHLLINSVPTAATAGSYAEIVRKYAALRRLAATGLRLSAMGNNPETDLDDVPDLYHAAIKDLTDGLNATPRTAAVPTVGDLFEGTLDGIENPPALQHVPTGIHDLDAVLAGGLRPGQLALIAARPAVGKALALDTPIPTPSGWITMGTVEVGQLVLGADGCPTQVTAATEVMYDRPCYEVEFSDGSVIVADADHQWLTETRAARRANTPPAGWVPKRDSPYSNDQRCLREYASVVTTKEILETLRHPTSERRTNHSVTNAKPLQLPIRDFSVPPYILGAWLGDGTSRSAHLTTADPEMVKHVESYGFRLERRRGKYQYLLMLPEGIQRRGAPNGTVGHRLRALGVLQNKHIPIEYLRASETQRRELLAGLLDTDGTVNAGGSVQFAVTSHRLASDAYELIVSLGYRCGWSTKRVRGRTPESSTAYTLTFTTDDDVFRLARKRLAHRERSVRKRAKLQTVRRYITDVRPVPSAAVRCIQVDNADHMYLAGRSMIPTHNSVMGFGVARKAAIDLGIPTLFVTLEMSADDCMLRLISAEAKVNLHHLQSGKLDERDWSLISHIAERVLAAPLYIDETPRVSVVHLRNTIRVLRRTAHIGLVVVDYLQLMGAPRADNREQQIAALSRDLKSLAQELKIPIVALCQLNRESEKRSDKRPAMSDLRESGSLEQEADVIVLMHREDAYERETPRAGECDLILAKNRSGPTATVTTAFQGHYARVVNMAAEPRTPYSAMNNAA